MTVDADIGRRPARVSVQRFSLPLSSPLGTAAGTIDERTGLLVAVEAGGATGVGEATPLAGWTESVDECRTALQTAADRAAEDGLAAALEAVAARETPAARHGLSQALLDCRARDDGVTLAASLRSSVGLESDPPSSVPANATVGDGTVAETVAAARSEVAAGFECLKLKVGARDPAGDRERLRAVRSAVGEDVALRADANGAWDRETAAELVAFLGTELAAAYVEQPLPAGDVAGHAALRGVGAPVALDESVRAVGVDAVLSAGAADVVVCKPMALGGIDLALEAAVRAREAGVTPVVTTTVDAAVARAGAVHLAAAIPDVPPCGLATGPLLAGDLLADPVPVVEGAVALPAGPGLGDAVEPLRAGGDGAGETGPE
jgi:o-succinylbenzoate synthase